MNSTEFWLCVLAVVMVGIAIIVWYLQWSLDQYVDATTHDMCLIEKTIGPIEKRLVAVEESLVLRNKSSIAVATAVMESRDTSALRSRIESLERSAHLHDTTRKRARRAI